ncbi:MAG: acetyltransferase [Roseivirga sp.]|nr:acetyltransferase [Roseivirga sp.]
MKKIAVFGKGGFGREVQMLIEQINKETREWDFIGFYDDDTSAESINGAPFLGSLDDLNALAEEVYLVFAIGNPLVKRNLIEAITNSNVKYPVLVHPSVNIGNREWVKIGEGSVICAGCIITVNINIGKHVILNLSCTVGHDVNIGDYSAFMPSINISGEVDIEPGVFVGTGTKIINQLKIGENTTVGAGAVVTKSLPANAVCVGMPAKPIKFKDSSPN